MSPHPSRHADHPIDPMFLQRWSPRAFTGEAIAPEDLMTMFEAARWAPSSGNSQPWRFIYARRDSADWEGFLSLLDDGNRIWAQRASALVLVVSATTQPRPGKPEPRPLPSHSFDTGCAWGMFALQALRLGWHTHGMIGFDAPRAARELGVPDDHHVEAMIAVGRRGDRSALPERLQEREYPNGREPLSVLVHEGRFAR